MSQKVIYEEKSNSQNWKSTVYGRIIYFIRTLFSFFNTSGYNKILQVTKSGHVIVKTEVAL